MVLDIIAGDSVGNVKIVPWEAQPQSRGTFGILSTCFVTLALCTWKIVHLNLPGICPDDDLKWSDWWKADRTVRHKLIHLCGGHQLVRQIGWLLIGLFAPELIAFAALKQYWDARELDRYMKEVYVGKSRGPSWWPKILRSRASLFDVEDPEEKPIWSMTHSFYAVMGGFTYELREGCRVYLPDDRERHQLTLRHEAIRFIAKHEPSIIPKLTVNEIRDKSKASYFVKVITLFQAIWFSLQCIVRMNQGLSISLLEVTTFAHCICALMVGWFWLQKPLSVEESNDLKMPHSIRQPHWLMALLYTLSSFDHKDSDDDRYRKTAQPFQKPAHTNHVYLSPNQDQDTQDERTASQLNLSASSSQDDTRPRSASQPTTPWPKKTQKLNPARAPAATQTSFLNLVEAASSADRSYKMRMRLAQKAWDHYVFKPAAAAAQASASASDPLAAPPPDPHKEQRRLCTLLRDTLVDRVHNFPRRHHLRHVTLRTHLGTTLTGLVYGGLHLLAWDATFASPAERWLWRLAALSVAGSGLLMPVAHVEDVVADAVRPFLLDDYAEDVQEAERLGRLGVRGFVRSYEGEHEDVVPGGGAAVGGNGEGAGVGEDKEGVCEETRSVRRRRDGWWHFWGLMVKACLGWVIEVLRVTRLVCVVVLGTVYVGLRVFIFVECLVNIGNLPESAYKVVQWSQYVPHIS